MSASINFECSSCEADYEVEIPSIIEHPAEIVCPNCGSKPPAHRAHAFATALEDLLAATAQIRKKVRFELSLDSHDLPAPYGAFEPGEAGLDFHDEEAKPARPKTTEESDEEEEEEEEEDDDEEDKPRRGKLFDDDEEEDLDEGFDDDDLDEDEEDEDDEDEDDEEEEEEED